MASGAVKSSLLAGAITIMSAQMALAHEVVPAIADMHEEGQVLHFQMRLSLEGLLAGIDLSAILDTNEAPEAAAYDSLRALSRAELEARARAFWPEMAAGVFITADGTSVAPELAGIKVEAAASPDLPRDSLLHFTVALPPGTSAITFAWQPRFGGIVLRQQGVEAPFTGFLQAGEASAPIALAGGGAKSGWQAFASYIPVGFEHILPKGLDHILFVLGLFFLSSRLRPLVWQVSAFTIAHTITLGMAALGLVTVPASIVEPLIAASIIYVAVENIFRAKLSYWRPLVVFGFGLLHGLGFASVLEQFGLPDEAFIPALIGFNIGVELGQLAVIAAAFALVGYWFGQKPWYRARIAIPASAAIAAMGAWWLIERSLL